MYWTLDNRPPTVEEILHQGASRIRAAVEAVCARYDAPQLEVPEVEESGTVRFATQQEAEILWPGRYWEFPGHLSAQAMARNYQQTLHGERMRALAAQQSMPASGLGGLANAGVFGLGCGLAASQQGFGRAHPSANSFLR